MTSQLFPYYQPIIETSSGRVVGYEVLARQTVEEEVVSGAQFLNDTSISVNSRVGVDRAVRRMALEQTASLGKDQYLAINISPEWVDNLDDHSVSPTLELLKELNVEPHQVLVEITELSGDLDKLKTLVGLYRECGMKVAIDDFGSGFSQLDRVAAFKPDIIKLDMAFFKQGFAGGRNSALVRMMGDLGARMGARIICEGVETEEEFFYALECNASYMQGYFFSPALDHFLPENTFEARVTELLERYTDQSVERISRQHFHAERVHQQLVAIRSCIRASDGDDWMETYLPRPEILRLYICDHSGKQISPNYENQDGTWQLDPSAVGHHWGWRPFIYQLIGMADLEQRITQSSPYLDIVTGNRCSTLSLVLDAQRILLADVRTEEIGESYQSSMINL